MNEEYNDEIRVGDTVVIHTIAGTEAVDVWHIYESGRLKVRQRNGHIIIIKPDVVISNLGNRD